MARRYDCSTVPGEPTGWTRRPWRFDEVSWWCCPGTPCVGLKLPIIVDTWVSDQYGDPHVEVHPHHPAA